jgi:hypothetical protein
LAPKNRFEKLSTLRCPILATHGAIKQAVAEDKVGEALSIIKKAISAE